MAGVRDLRGMKNSVTVRSCVICEASVPEYHTFCSQCSARWQFRGHAKTEGDRKGLVSSLINRLKAFWAEHSRSATENKFDAACDLGIYDPEDAIYHLDLLLYTPRLDASLRRRIEWMLTLLYVEAWGQRLRELLFDLRSFSSLRGERETRRQGAPCPVYVSSDSLVANRFRQTTSSMKH